MINDLRFAFRMIATHRWFSAAVIVTLALGIGINTTVFTLVNAVLFKPVPIPRGDRLVTIRETKETDPGSRFGISYPDFLNFKSDNQTFDDLEAASLRGAVISDNGIPPEQIRMARVTAGLFKMLRTPPVLGRDFAAGEDQSGREPVALIGYGVWQERYAGASDVLGRKVRIDGAPATIIGVMPEDFQFPSNEDVWMPFAPTEDNEKRDNRSLQVFGILKRGTSIGEAGRDLGVIGQRLATEFPDTNQEFVPQVLTFHEAFNGGPIRAVFLMMLGAVGFVLLIACANVANMMLSRAVGRRREISIRAAMGASRWQIARQLLVESVLLSCLGGLLGLALSTIGVHAFDQATQDVGKPYWVLFTMNYVAFGYFGLISILSGIVFGIVPALRASRVDLNTALKDDTRSGTFRGGKLTGALVVLQCALTLVLLAGAGMMMRSFFSALSINGFVPSQHLLSARIQLPESKGERYADGASRARFQEELLPKIAALPGVTRAAITTNPPGLGAGNRPIEIEGRPNEDPKQAPRASFVIQSDDFLPMIHVPILLGRGFQNLDGRAGHEAAVVTRAFAARHWPDRSAVGERFRFVDNKEPGPWMTVIGVCADVIQSPREKEAPPLVFISNRQEAWGWFAVMLSTTGDPVALTASVRSAVQTLDSDLPLFEVRTVAEAIERSNWFLAVFGSLFITFALIALLMASVGIYAVVAQSTASRTREIGIRMALGATSRRILRLVLSRGIVQLGIGLVIGLAGAIAATRLLGEVGFLVQVSPNDPIVFVSVTALLVGIGLFACWLPARRAAALHPVKALHHE